MSLGMPAEHIEETPRSLQTLKAMLSQGQGICPFGPQIKRKFGRPAYGTPLPGASSLIFCKTGPFPPPSFSIIVDENGG